MARITDVQKLKKGMVIKQINGMVSKIIVLTSDPYEKFPGEWFINVALQSDLSVKETLYLPKYGIRGTFSDHSFETV